MGAAASPLSSAAFVALAFTRCSEYTARRRTVSHLPTTTTTLKCSWLCRRRPSCRRYGARPPRWPPSGALDADETRPCVAASSRQASRPREITRDYPRLPERLAVERRYGLGCLQLCSLRAWPATLNAPRVHCRLRCPPAALGVAAHLGAAGAYQQPPSSSLAVVRSPWLVTIGCSELQVLKLNADYYADKYQKLQEKAGTQQASKRSPEITRDHPRSPEPSQAAARRIHRGCTLPRLHLGYIPRLISANLGRPSSTSTARRARRRRRRGTRRRPRCWSYFRATRPSAPLCSAVSSPSHPPSSTRSLFFSQATLCSAMSSSC